MKKNFPNTRLRRLRLTKSIRNLLRENSLSPCDLIQTIFLIEGKSKKEREGTRETRGERTNKVVKRSD